MSRAEDNSARAADISARAADISDNSARANISDNSARAELFRPSLAPRRSCSSLSSRPSATGSRKHSLRRSCERAGSSHERHGAHYWQMNPRSHASASSRSATSSRGSSARSRTTCRRRPRIEPDASRGAPGTRVTRCTRRVQAGARGARGRRATRLELALGRAAARLALARWSFNCKWRPRSRGASRLQGLSGIPFSGPRPIVEFPAPA